MEWFWSSAFLIDLYIPLIKNQNEIDNSILSHIFNIILHQISLIDFKVDEENSKFSEISFFLETSNKFMTLIFIYCQRILNEDVFNLSFLLIDKATQLPLIKISVKETIYDLYAVLIQKFPSQLCALFSQNRRIESFILNMISSNEFMNILSNKAIRVHQKWNTLKIIYKTRPHKCFFIFIFFWLQKQLFIVKCNDNILLQVMFNKL